VNKFPKGYFQAGRNSFAQDSRDTFELTRSVVEYRVNLQYHGAYDNKLEMVCLAFDLSDESVSSSQKSPRWVSPSTQSRRSSSWSKNSQAATSSWR